MPPPPRMPSGKSGFFLGGFLHPLFFGKDPLAQPDALRRHLDELVVVDEFVGLLKGKDGRRGEAERLVRPGRRMLVTCFFLQTLTAISSFLGDMPTIMPS